MTTHDIVHSDICQYKIQGNTLSFHDNHISTTVLRIRCCRRHAIRWNGSRFLGYLKRFKHYANAPICYYTRTLRILLMLYIWCKSEI